MGATRKSGVITACLLLGLALTSAVPAQTPSAPCTLSVEAAAASPQSHLGDSACWSGTVRDVVSSNIPVKLLVKTGKAQWLVMVYDPNSLDDRALIPKTKVFANGTLYGTEKVTFEGVEIRVPAISATRISCDDPQQPRRLAPQDKPMRKVPMPKAPSGYKDKQ